MKGIIYMRSTVLGRRTALAGGVALAGTSLIRPREARAAQGLTVVLESEVTILDPHATTAAITRTFGLHVFDTLFAMTDKGEIKPQMVESYDSSPDKLTWSFVLRDGLKWHDGTPVTAEDCVASLKRWSVRDPQTSASPSRSARARSASSRTSGGLETPWCWSAMPPTCRARKRRTS